MRRRAGVGAIQKKKVDQVKFKEKGEELAETSMSEMAKQMETFRKNLEEFSRNHKQEIKRDPEFRKHFQDMCASIGVDPLASGKGFWSEMLGFGDYYYELGVQIIEVCMATSHKTGGFMELEELRRRLAKSRRIGCSGTRADTISQDDVLRAIKKLKILGNGFTVIPLGSAGRYLIQSVPGELSMDQTAVLQVAEANGGEGVAAADLCANLSWEKERSIRTLEKLVSEGVAWVDHQGDGEDTLYWIPSLFSSALA